MKVILRTHVLVFLSLFVFFTEPVIASSLQHHKDNPRTTSTHSDSIQVINLASDKLNLYLDCPHCDTRYIQTEVNFINYVRDRNDADVHLFVTRAGTAGGTEYTLKFLGKQKFAGQNDTLKYFSPKTDTDDIERRGLVKRIKLGLIGYVAHYSLADQIEIVYHGGGKAQMEPRKDPWNRWLFEVEANAWTNGEESRNEFGFYSGIRAERITKDWKLRFRTGGDYHRERYELSEGDTTTHRNSQYYSGLVAKSLSPHWSVGFYSHANSSTYDNIDISTSLSPAVEYNIFPYSEYSQHELSFLYRVSPQYSDYTEETIYFKRSEFLLEQAFSVRLEITQPWGSIESRVEGSHYFHDWSKNKLEFDSELNIQLYRGLSFEFHGGYSVINDQLSLPGGSTSDTDVLLDLRQQATSYSYYTSLGLSYTFGSIYSNTVNPRL